MKNVFLLCFIALATLSVNAQDLHNSEVPETVKKVITSKFPDAYDLEWEKSGENLEAEFDINRYDHSVWINATGDILQQKSEMSKTDLPGSVIRAIENKYASYRVDDTYKIRSGENVYYKVDLENSSSEMKVYILESGEIVTAPTLLN